MKKKVWILNHYATYMLVNEGGRHYWFAKYLRKSGYEPTVFSCNTKHNGGGFYFDDNCLWKTHMAETINTPFVVVRARKYIGNGKQRILTCLIFTLM